MAKPDIAGRRVLVVDDEPLVSESIRRLLALDRHEAVVAPNAEEALAIFTSQKFDLVITDYDLPGMKGDELASAIKSLTPNQPVALITAFGEALHAAGARLAGVDLVLGKPFALAELRQAVARLIAGKTAPGPDSAG